MIEKDLDSKPSRNAYASAIDAQRRNLENIDLYTDEQVEHAIAVLDLVRSTFIRSKCYINYREKFIAIKVNKPTMADRLNAGPLDDDLAAQDIHKVITAQGYVYRLYEK